MDNIYVQLGLLLVLAITLHEFGHAACALYLGDDTAQKEGRVTLNPLAHLDPLGAIAFVLVHFGWGKPVPVNVQNFRHPRRDHALVAVSGPLMNLMLAGIFGALVVNRAMFSPTLDAFFLLGLHVNALLMIFNLLPFPPLDGGAILALFIKDPVTYVKVQQVGPVFFLGLLLLQMGFGVPVFSYVLDPPVALLKWALTLGQLPMGL